ncbi:MAG: D-alanyl-D-alanine endopeptidase [Betaproteobacteria bacterium]|nr:D-alanyl-D-alanine endopeptidase [Betaproteobacteria bacterium]
MFKPLALAALIWFGVACLAPASAQDQVRAPKLRSNAAIVIDQDGHSEVLSKNAEVVTPIASITKLMTAMVVLDKELPLDEELEITHDDLDFIKGTHSRLRLGTVLSRGELLKLALMASENRAASALGRYYPGGSTAFVVAMNRKAAALGMKDTHFVDSTGLNPENVSTANDLAKLVSAAFHYRLIRDFTTSESHYVEMPRGSRYRVLTFNNSNGLIRSSSWDIGLSKTGYISEAGRCLVMQASIAEKPFIIVLLDSWGKLSRMADANRIKHWIERREGAREPAQHHASTSDVRRVSARVSRTIRSRYGHSRAAERARRM